MGEDRTSRYRVTMEGLDGLRCETEVVIGHELLARGEYRTVRAVAERCEREAEHAFRHMRDPAPVLCTRRIEVAMADGSWASRVYSVPRPLAAEDRGYAASSRHPETWPA